jgi:hypothetical protein
VTRIRAEAHYALAMDAIASGDAGPAAPELAAAVRHYQNLGHFEGLTRCLGALSAVALQRGNPHLAARLMGTAAAVRDRFGLKPWPWVIQAEGRTIKRAARCCRQRVCRATGCRSQPDHRRRTRRGPVDPGRPTASRRLLTSRYRPASARIRPRR